MISYNYIIHCMYEERGTGPHDLYEEKVQGRWGRVATRCAAIAEHVEDSRREDDIIMIRFTMSIWISGN